MGKKKRKLNRYESIYANIPLHHKKVIFYTLAVSIILMTILVYFTNEEYSPASLLIICDKYVVPLLLSIIASAVFALVYSSMSGLREMEDVATILYNKIYHSCPAHIYRATNIQENQFKEELLKGIIDCESFYYYEGVDLHTASYCILNGLSRAHEKTFPETHFILTRMGLLQKEQGIQLLKSIISIRTFLDKYNLIINSSPCQIELQMYIHILNYDSGFHIHLTDKYLWLSPFRGSYKYPTTYKYRKSDSLDSYYKNFYDRMNTIIRNPQVKKVQLNIEDAYNKLWSVLGVNEFIRKYNLNNVLLECKSTEERFHKLSNIPI